MVKDKKKTRDLILQFHFYVYSAFIYFTVKNVL